MGRSTIVLGALLIAGSFAATKDLGYEDVTQQIKSSDRAASDAWWRHEAVTVRPDQIFEN